MDHLIAARSLAQHAHGPSRTQSRGRTRAVNVRTRKPTDSRATEGKHGRPFLVWSRVHALTRSRLTAALKTQAGISAHESIIHEFTSAVC